VTAALPDHGCLGCNRLETGPVVTLINGVVVCNFCEAYRAECEARHILAMSSKEQRREYLAGVSRKRGEAAGLALGDLVKAVWSVGRPA